METRTLVLVEDDELADEVLRVAAAAGCEVDRVWDIAEARRRWAAAPLVLVGADTLPRLPEAGLGRRRGVLAVSTSPLPEGNWRAAVLLGVDRVVTLPGDDELLVTALADATEPPATRAAPVVGVLGGRGGAGASTFAASVAWASARWGGHPLLVDCDPLGGGLDLALGMEKVSGLRWSGCSTATGRLTASTLRSALPAVDEGAGRLTVLSCDRPSAGGAPTEPPSPEALLAVLDAGHRAGEPVVLDLPRELPPAVVACLWRLTLCVLVVPAEVRACAAAGALVRRLTHHGCEPRLVVRGPAPGGLTARDVSTAVGVPVLTTMRPEPGLAGRLDRGAFRGRPRGPLATAAERVLGAAGPSAAQGSAA
ncbi:septum site-determining protein Ssd [Actinoalloteichus caeruleus]|uniref:Helicase/secretion neighborhood CpaE-like protein n=1 Tax=Actinoalloteichus caeruleus DSM 43889 TaxID=1120930 RepID=A0ABT1JJM2_ACTCY|nr:septum site-determining protein Ssd [Actinoalloteichus caeruleus]MCP2332712.1 helicase/secretion neighborhood CpaE-like protein [Actinoalloteichus caeruleus DSM 43889]